MRTVFHSALKYFVWCTLCVAWLPASAEWQPTLATAEHKNYRGADEVFRIRIPSDVPVEELQRLALELDNIDVTAMIQREAEYAVFQPLQPLSPGYHELRIVEYADDGSILERGFWRFEVRQSRLFRELAVAADTRVTGSYRAADDNLATPRPDRLQGQGSSRIGYRASSGDWNTRGEFDLLYNSLNDDIPGRRQIDNGEFLFSAGNRYVDARVGHQTVGTSSLVMNNFRRRGVSLEGRIPLINSRVSGFSLSSEDIVGFRRGLGISDSQRRVDGVTFDSSPLKDKPQALYLSGTWLSGQGRDAAGLVASIDDREAGRADGSAWSLSADSQLLDNRLRLRAEYAATDYDFNTSDSLGSESDTAYSLLATFSDSTAAGLNWNTGVESRKIGTFFKSLGNLALPSDRRLLRAFGGAQWSTVGVQASIEQQKDNVEDIDTLPRIETGLGSISLNWSPALASADGWLGAPSLGAAFNRQQQDQTSTPSGFLQPKTDNDLDSWQAYAMFSYPSGSWGLTLVNTQYRDHSGVQNDTDTTGVYLDGSWRYRQRLSLAPSIRFDRTEDKVIDQSSMAITYALQTAFVLLPNKLDGSLDVSLNRNQTTDDSINNDIFSVSMAFSWRLLQARRNHPGFDLGLSGIYNDIDDDVVKIRSIDTYQAFLTLTATLPTRAGQAQ